MWEVEFTNEFDEWYQSLTEDQQTAVKVRVAQLQNEGPNLGRPVVDTIVSSRHSNLKELRYAEGGQLRVLFAFDPRRTAIFLLGGDEAGKWKSWYKTATPMAETLYSEYLEELKSEGLL